MPKPINQLLPRGGTNLFQDLLALKARQADCVDLTIGEPDADTQEEIRRQTTKAMNEGHTHYPPFSGKANLRKALADYERRRHGLDIDPECIVVTTGATEAIFSSLLTLLNPGDEVLLPCPAFLQYRSAVELAGGKAVCFDTTAEGFQLRRHQLQPLVTERTKAILLCSPGNPTGSIYDEESLRLVRDLALAEDLYVISDEVYREFVYEENQHFISEYRELADRLLICQSFSKTYAMTGFRLGYVILPPAVVGGFSYVHQNVVATAVNFIQDACVEALRLDVSQQRELYRRRRDYVLMRLRQMGLDLPAPKGAFYVFLDLAKMGLEGSSLEWSKRLIEEAGVALLPSAFFGTEGGLRLSYCYSVETLEKGLDRLEVFLKQWRTRGA